MLTKVCTQFVAILISASLFILAGCSGSGTSASTQGQGSISAKLTWDKVTAKSVASAPSDVVTVRISISGTGMTTMQQTFPASAGSGTISGVPAGTGRTVTASALGSTNNLLYQGVVSNVTVVAGQTTDVVTVIMMPAPVLSADQAVYEQFVLSPKTSYKLYWNLPVSGLPVSGSNYFVTNYFSLPASPLINGTQRMTNSPLTSISSTLTIPAAASAPVRYLVSGQIVVGSNPIYINDISYQGTAIKEDMFAVDGTTVVERYLRTNYSTVPLTGAVISAPTDFAQFFGALYYNSSLLSSTATWGAGAAYTKFTQTNLGDTYQVFDYGTTTTTGNTPAPVATSSTLSVLMSSVGIAADGTTYTLSNGIVSTINGIKTYVASNPMPNRTTTQYRTFFELNGNVYTGSLIKDGTVIGGSAYPVAVPGTSLGYAWNYSNRYQIRLNAAAVTTLQSAVTTATASPAQVAMQAGIYSTDMSTYQSGATSVAAYAVERVGLATDGITLTDTYTYYDPTLPGWTSTRPTAFPTNIFSNGGAKYFLSTSGTWVSGSDGPQYYSSTFNSDGTVTVTNNSAGTSGNSGNITITPTDVSGQATITAATSLSWPVNSTAIFPSGSIRYNMVWTSVKDTYSLNSSNIISSSITNLNQVPATVSQVYIDHNGSVSYYAQFTGGTTVTLFQGAGISIGTSSYAINTVNGQQILEITIPDSLRSQYLLGGNPICAIVGGNLYAGKHIAAGSIDYSNGGESWNLTAIQFLENNKL